jgi:hypothetical protein
MRRDKQRIVKPYVVPTVDNRPLPYTSRKSMCLVKDFLRPEKHDGDLYERNPFWIALYGGSEFQLMKTVRLEYPKSQVIEFKDI